MDKYQILNISNIEQKIYELYILQNMPLSSLAKYFNCSVATIARVLHELNITKDKQLQAQNVKNSAALKYEIDKDKLQDYFNNHSVEDTASYFNIPIHRFYTIMKQLGLDKSLHKEFIDKQSRLAGKSQEEKQKAIAKGFETKFKNNSFKKSAEEDRLYELLTAHFPQYKILRFYSTDSRYPFNCDFYISELDLFIEYQGRRFHGPKPFNEFDSECWDEVEYMENHHTDPSTFTVRDPKKLKIACENKINLLLIYPKNDSYLVTNSQLKNIGKFDVTKINDLC